MDNSSVDYRWTGPSDLEECYSSHNEKDPPDIPILAAKIRFFKVN